MFQRPAKARTIIPSPPLFPASGYLQGGGSCRHRRHSFQHYDEFDVDAAFAKYAAEKNIVRDTALEAKQPERTRHSDDYLHLVLKAQVARNLFGTEYYYRIMCAIDEGYQRAVRELRVEN